MFLPQVMMLRLALDRHAPPVSCGRHGYGAFLNGALVIQRSKMRMSKVPAC
jgi:hypothetical protein